MHSISHCLILLQQVATSHSSLPYSEWFKPRSPTSQKIKFQTKSWHGYTSLKTVNMLTTSQFAHYICPKLWLLPWFFPIWKSSRNYLLFDFQLLPLSSCSELSRCDHHWGAFFMGEGEDSPAVSELKVSPQLSKILCLVHSTEHVDHACTVH